MQRHIQAYRQAGIHTHRHTVMFAYTRAGMPTYRQTYPHTSTHTYIHGEQFIHTSIQSNTHTYNTSSMQTPIHTYIQSIHTGRQAQAYTYRRTGIHTYIVTHIHSVGMAYIHTYTGK